MQSAAGNQQGRHNKDVASVQVEIIDGNVVCHISNDPQ
jgi:hypothetical protein